MAYWGKCCPADFNLDLAACFKVLPATKSSVIFRPVLKDSSPNVLALFSIKVRKNVLVHLLSENVLQRTLDVVLRLVVGDYRDMLSPDNDGVVYFRNDSFLFL